MLERAIRKKQTRDNCTDVRLLGNLQHTGKPASAGNSVVIEKHQVLAASELRALIVRAGKAAVLFISYDASPGELS